MTRSYTFTQARQNLAAVLKQAAQDGEVLITHRDGRKFILKVAPPDRSPLDVPGVDTGMTMQEAIASIRESREMDYLSRRVSYSHKKAKKQAAK